jgi:hypothetical protein
MTPTPRFAKGHLISKVELSPAVSSRLRVKYRIEGPQLRFAAERNHIN